MTTGAATPKHDSKALLIPMVPVLTLTHSYKERRTGVLDPDEAGEKQGSKGTTEWARESIARARNIAAGGEPEHE